MSKPAGSTGWGIAINQGDGDPATWFADVLGAGVKPSFAEPGDEHLTTMVALGNMQFAVFAAPGPEGMIGRFVERYGAGLHSLAWRVDDMWVTENILRARDITITGTNIEARHFFMHPRETFGVLIEWTDMGQEIEGTDARAELAWITERRPRLRHRSRVLRGPVRRHASSTGCLAGRSTSRTRSTSRSVTW